MSSDLSLLLFTAQVALTSTLLILVPGLLLAWALSKPGWCGRALVEGFVTLPLVLPTVYGLIDGMAPESSSSTWPTLRSQTSRWTCLRGGR